MEASALVTGGASGLGAATAARLAAEGFAVTRLDRVAGDGVFAGDVTQPDDLTAAISAATATAPLRVCVTCAGVGTVGRVIGHDDDAFRRTIEVNLIGTFSTLRAAATAMAGNEPDAEGQRGVIVLTASIAAFEGQIGQIAYSASKGGVAGMVLPAARDLARSGIRVAGIAPGLFDTPLLAGLPEPARLALGASVPNPPRLGRPAEFADLVWAIVRNPMVNGETIRIDGGLRMAPR
jgi:NAD(P)-dependent dehydrogenase (short-subunit alcohol dehydrogenase family)